MDVIISGIIINALPIQSGTSQRGNQWSRQSYIIEHESGQYPKRMVFDAKDAKIQELALQIGQQVTVHLNVDCHEYPENSGKWFNSLSAWKVDRPQMQQGYQQPMQQGYQQMAPMPQVPQQPMPQQGYQMPYAQPMMPQQPIANAPGTVAQPMQQAPAPFPPQQQAMPQGQQMQTQQLPFPPAQ